MDPIALLRASSRRMAVVWSRDLGIPLVYVLHRVGSPAFVRLALTTLAAAGAQADDADELRERLLAASTPEDRERIVAEHQAAVRSRGEGTMRGAQADPEQLRALVASADELVMSGVAAVGIGREDIDLQPGLLPLDAQPRDYCQPLEQPSDSSESIYLRPVRWSGGGGVDRLEIQQIDEQERIELALRIGEAFSPTRAAASFPRGPGDALDRGPMGKAVRAEAKRTAAVGRPDRRSRRSGGDGGRE